MIKFFQKYFVIAVLVLTPMYASAITQKEFLEGTGKYAKYQTSGISEYSVAQILGKIINIFLGFLGIVFVILVLMAGYNWMTASGDEAKVEKAKETLWRAIIGIIIVVGSYAIWNFVAKYLIGSI